MDEERLRRAETHNVNGTFYRFHRARYFESSAIRFYKNFIETRAGFESSGRFAPARAQCGFYFAKTSAIASAEALFYAGVTGWHAVLKSTPADVLAELGRRGDERVFLEVELAIDRLVDFTNWRNVDTFMRHGTPAWKGKQLEYEVQYLAGLICERPTGNDLTDILGVDAKSVGMNGVIFPSVRALMFEGTLPKGIMIRQSHDHIVNMSAAAGIMDLEWQGAEQLKQEWNMVVFSGTALTRSIWKISWLDRHGKTGSLDNPYHAASAETIELARLRERAHRGLDPESAAKEGLLTEAEADVEFYSNTIFVKNK